MDEIEKTNDGEIKITTIEKLSMARQRAKDLHSATHLRFRLDALAAYGNKCAFCGETEIQFLSIDHIWGNGTQHRKEIGVGGDTFYRWLKKNNYPPEFQVLCHNCNMAKGLYGVCPHKTKRETERLLKNE